MTNLRSGIANDLTITVTILTGDVELSDAIERYLHFLFSGQVAEIFQASLGKPETMQPEMLTADLWIAEALNPVEIENPEGFRTAKKLAGKTRFLLLFSVIIPSAFPKEGSFWLYLPSHVSLSTKIKKIMLNPISTDSDYQKLEDLWPLLKRGPSHHHHHHTA